MTDWQSFAVTDVGVKRQVNQDAIYSDSKQKLWIVADGMGGHSDGDKASKAIVNAFANITLSTNLADRVVQIETILRLINDELQHYSATVLNGRHTGSTVVLLTECEGITALIWAGDSRCYQINQSEINQLSWDHSHVDEMLRAGHISAEEAATSKLSNVITRAIGAHNQVHFDHVFFKAQPATTYLLCSDGLTNELNDRNIFDVVNRSGCSQSTIDDLLALTIQSGAKDNVSIVIAQNLVKQQAWPTSNQLLSALTTEVYILSQAYFHEEMEQPQYYQSLRQLISPIVTQLSSSVSIDTNKVNTRQINEGLRELPTNNYPKITDEDLNQNSSIQPSIDKHYMLLLTLVVLLTASLGYFLFK